MSGHADLYRPKKRRKTDKERQRLLVEKIERARDQGHRAVILSHGYCLDGVGSVIVALRAFGREGVGIAYVQPSDMAAALTALADQPGPGRRLLIADLSLNPDQFDTIVDACERLDAAGWEIEWRDHHHKQWEGVELSRLESHLKVLEVNTDATESGASLMQKALAPRDSFAKRLANTIKDRDLWWNKDPDSETLEFAITWMETEPFTDHFVPKKSRAKVVDDIIAKAAADQQALVEEHTAILLKDAQYFESQGGKVGVVYGWLPKNVGLHRVLEQPGVEMAINVRPNGKMSLRSAKEAPVCHLVARRFSGGGHPNASGGDLGLKGLSYKWYVWRRGRVGKTNEVAAAAVAELDNLVAASGSGDDADAAA